MTFKRIYKILKRLFIVLLLLLVAFFSYVEFVNRNAVNMTYRQKLLKTVYPAWMWWLNLTGKNITKLEGKNANPIFPFYSLKDTLIDGTPFNFESLKGKKILLVNTASDCGYTGQYTDLQKLSEKYKEKLVVIGFPANDFKEQERGGNAEIAQFCKINFGVSFPLMKKSSVVKGANQNEIFNWLTNASKNGWNDKQPTWNFCKYLVDENGRLVNYFGSSVEPFSAELINAIKK